MNKTRGSRKRDREMLVKIAILQGDIKRSIDLCERFGITTKRYGELVRQVEATAV